MYNPKMNLIDYISSLTNTSKVYLINRFLYGLRFFIPIWLLFYLNYISISQVGIIEASGFIVGMILEVPTGAFADIFGRRTSLIIGKLGVAISFIIAVIFNATIPFVIGIMLSNAMWSFISGSESAMVYDDLKENGREGEFAKVSSIGNTIFRISIIIASFAGGFLYNIWIGLPIFLYAITNVIEAIFWYFTKEPNIDSEKFSFKEFLKTIKEGANQVFKTPKVIYFTFSTTIFLAFTTVTNDFFNYNLAIDLGLDANQQSLLFGFTAILKTFAVMAIGYLLVKKEHNSILNWIYVAYIILLIPMFFTNNLWGLVLLILIDALTAASPVLFDTVLHSQFESKTRATAISFANMISTLIIAIILIIGMKAIEVYGSRPIFTVLGISLLILFVLFRIYYYIQNSKVNI
jgi:MFS family permease